jgi:hypothetical protein
MKQLFKTTLLAAAVAATCGTANAGTVAVTKQVHSKEGLDGVTASQTSNNITYTLGATYREGDKLTLTLPTGTLNKTNPSSGFPSVVVMDAINVGDTRPDMTVATEETVIAGLTWGLLNANIDVDVNGTKYDQVTYRVTALTLPQNAGVDIDNGSTVGGVIGIDDDNLVISYNPQVLLTSDIKVTVSSQTQSGDILDNTGTREATIAEAKSQFGALTVGTKFNGVIDVEQSRLQFTDGTMDSMAFSIANPDVSTWLNTADVTSAKANIYGEAGKQTGLKDANWASAGGAGNPGGTVTYTVDAAKVSVAYGSAVTNDTINFTAPASGDGVVLQAQEFTTDFTYTYDSAGGTKNLTHPVATGAKSGEWTLNGATVNIPYMPYSATASQIIYVTNASALAGDITATAFDDKGNMYDLGKIATANAKSVQKVTAQVNQALGAKGFTGGKVSLTITVNVPADDVTVYASYNAGSVRGFVNTDQYKGMK